MAYNPKCPLCKKDMHLGYSKAFWLCEDIMCDGYLSKREVEDEPDSDPEEDRLKDRWDL